MNVDDLSFQICKMPEDSKSVEEGYRTIREGLWRLLTDRTSNVKPPRTIAILIRDKRNCIVGGVIGYAMGGWLLVDLLWVEESLRHKGYGTKLLKMVENEAVKLGCKYAHLETFSFEARPFYEKHGYTLFATLDTYPEEHSSKHFLKKNLA
jgi:GNAT superfamily N-acetyltransferase